MRVIDIHTHGYGACGTQSSDPDDIIRMAGFHGTSGTNAILAAVYASPVPTMRRDLLTIKTAMGRQRENVALMGAQQTAQILGVYLEGPFLNPDMAGALDAGSFLPPTVDNYMRLVEGFEDIVRVITIAPEVDGADALIRFLSGRGIIVSMGHSNATYAEAKAGYDAGARGITHIFNAMRPFHHREPGIAGFALMEPGIYIEMIADPYHLSDAAIEFVFRAKDPARIILVSDMVCGPLTGDVSPALRDDSGRLRGGSMTISDAAKRIIGLGIDPRKVEQAISSNPEKYLATGLLSD